MMQKVGDQIATLWSRHSIWVVGLLLSVAAGMVALSRQDIGVLLFGLLLSGAMLRIILHEVALSRLVRLIRADSSLPPLQALRARCRNLIEANHAVAHRFAQRHAVSGLPTRELLIIAMEAGPGILGLIEFADYDRLGAVDPQRANTVLGEIARRIERMAGVQRLIAHVDRARFAIWFDDEEEPAAAAALRAIAYALQNPIATSEGELLPVVRIGHLDCDPARGSAELMLTRAFSLLASEQLGRGSSLEGASVAIQSDYALEQDLRRAIVSGEFELHFQPFVDARTESVCGSEALLRWQHPERGMVPPSVFIPIAEAAHLANELGSWVIDAACRAAGNWHASDHAIGKIAINLSAQQLERIQLLPFIERSLARHRLPASLLEIELTETVAAVDSAAAAHLFAKLRALGVSLSIDDFGTGFSSLSYLKKLSFDKLKIDREFITEVDLRKDSQAICNSIIALGRGLGISVLAEGVERPEEALWLRQQGCFLYQGFYFSQPRPASEFLAFVKDQNALDHLFAFQDGTSSVIKPQRIAS